MHAILRGSRNEPVDMIWHDFPLDYLTPTRQSHFPDDGFQAGIHRLHPYWAALFRAPDHMLLARRNPGVVALIVPGVDYTTRSGLIREKTLAHGGRITLYPPA
jgi:hypothetical protein